MDAIANHVQKEYKGGPKIAKAIEELSLPTIFFPNYQTVNSGGNVDPGDMFMWQQDVQVAKKRTTLLVKNKKHVYALVLRQCSTELVSKIKGSDQCVQADADQDLGQLLAIIRGYCCRFDDHQQSTYRLEGAKHRVLNSTSPTMQRPLSTWSISRRWLVLWRCMVARTGMSWG